MRAKKQNGGCSGELKAFRWIRTRLNQRRAGGQVARSTESPTNVPAVVSLTRQTARPVPGGLFWLRRRIEEGNEFNRRREPYYEEQGGANEVHVEPRSERGQYPRVDSYVPGEEIVSRKHTQLSDVQEGTAVGYLRELANTYGPGTIVADTPTNRRDLGDEAIGQPMDGDMVLEVPVQRDGVPPAVLAEARRLGIIIRDEEGNTY